MTDTPISTSEAEAGVVGMLAALEAGATTAECLVERAIERATAANRELNFIAWPTFDRAREQARAGRAGPLAGVPTLIKESLGEKGLPLPWGSRAFRDHVAAGDDPYTRAIDASGAVSIARSTMPEMGLNVVTESPLTGITRNPWSLEHSPGGSSGGGSAAVAAGVVPLAHASDGLGSIRHGAAPCGLVGLKPSRGRPFGDEGLESITDLAVNGCVSRTVRDTALWLSATQSRASHSTFAPVPDVVSPVAGSLRIHAHSSLMRTGEAPDASVQHVFAHTIDLLEDLGHQVQQGSLPFNGEVAIPALLEFIEGNFSRQVEERSQQAGIAVRPDDLEHRSATLFSAGKHISDGRLGEVLLELSEAADAYRRGFGDMDIWMTPTFSTEIVRVGTLSPSISWLEQREHLVDYAGYGWIDNFAGTPSISLPTGLSHHGLPVGIQFSAEPGAEVKLLSLAYELEAALAWSTRRPPLWFGDHEVAGQP